MSPGQWLTREHLPQPWGDGVKWSGEDLQLGQGKGAVEKNKEETNRLRESYWISEKERYYLGDIKDQMIPIQTKDKKNDTKSNFVTCRSLVITNTTQHTHTHYRQLHQLCQSNTLLSIADTTHLCLMLL